MRTAVLTGVELPNVAPPGSTATIDIAGPGDAAAVTITIDGATVEAMAIEAFDTEARHPTRRARRWPSRTSSASLPVPITAGSVLTIGAGRLAGVVDAARER